jgi:hypothetical protein
MYAVMGGLNLSREFVQGRVSHSMEWRSEQRPANTLALGLEHVLQTPDAAIFSPAEACFHTHT